VGVFLSYAREDTDILEAVTCAFEGLRQKAYQHLNIFFDTKSINVGEVFDDKIRAALRAADYLVILYTGRYKRSHSYTGFEVGYFASVMDEEAQTSASGKSSRQLVAMYIDEPPGTMQGVQGIDLTIPIQDLNADREAYMAQVRTKVNDDPLTRFFDDVGAKVESRLPEGMVDKDTLARERIERIQAVRELVPVLRGAMYDCLSRRVARHTIEQRLITFELPKGSAKEAEEEIPNDAVLTQESRAFELFGIHLDESTMTWKRFKERILSTSGTSKHLAVKAIERAFVSAVSPSITRDNEQIIRGIADNNIYRIVVTRHYDYYDGRKVLNMYLIESLQPSIFGDEDTSIILGFIDIAAKYRFMFVEDRSPFSLMAFRLEKNRLEKTPKQLQEKVRALIRELLLLEDESRVLHLDTPRAVAVYAKGLSLSEVIELQQKWLGGREKLIEAADTLLHTEPESDTFAELFEAWLSALEHFTDISKHVNSTVALQALESLKKVFQE
jgi:hypothetical protein